MAAPTSHHVTEQVRMVWILRFLDLLFVSRFDTDAGGGVNPN